MSRAVVNSFLPGDGAARELGRPTKVVVRRLPPDFTLDAFLDQASPLPKYNYLYFVGGGGCKGPNAFSRAYVNLDGYDDVVWFKEKFDNYLFLGANGTEYPAVVEFAPFQDVPEEVLSDGKDVQAGTIQFDDYYKEFLDGTRRKRVEEVQRFEFCLQPKTDDKTTCMTPLLRYIKDRKTSGDEKFCSSLRSFSRGRGRCYENCIVFVNSAVKKPHRGYHVRKGNSRKLTFA